MNANAIEKIFLDYVKENRIAGATYSVFQGDKTLCHATIGYANTQDKTPLKDNAIFRLASMTKPITTVALLILMERGLIDIDQPVGRYLDGFNHGGVGNIINENLRFLHSAKEITIKDCLTHSSGLGSGIVGDKQLCTLPKPKHLVDNVNAWNGAFLDFAPGASTAYSAVVAFELLALIVQTVSKITFDNFLKKEIFDPLGMVDTCYTLSDSQKTRLVQMCKTGKDGNLENVDYGFSGFHVFEQGYTGGSAGLFSTLDDYSRFAKMLLGKGEYNGVKILSRKSVELMKTEQISKSDYESWGLGVRVIKKQDQYQSLPVNAFGWSGAYGTHFWIDPSTNKCAVFMLNKADVNGAGSIYSKKFEQLVEQYIK